jgi:hypothetical protein
LLGLSGRNPNFVAGFPATDARCNKRSKNNQERNIHSKKFFLEHLIRISGRAIADAAEIVAALAEKVWMSRCS